MDLVEISINIAGNDYSINVDMDTAQTLLNGELTCKFCLLVENK